jgi:hypothetical protein
MSGEERCGTVVCMLMSRKFAERGWRGGDVRRGGGRKANFPVHTLRNLLFSGLKNFNLSLPLADPSFVNSRRSIASGGHYGWV